MSLTCNSLRLVALPALALLAACGEAAENNAVSAADTNVMDAVASSATQPESEPGRVVHTIAPAARDHAGLVALLDADAARGRAVMEAASKGSQASRGWRKDWRVTARTSRLIAVAAERVAPTQTDALLRTDAVLWDTRGERPLTAERLFTDPVAALALIETAFCERLEAERAREHGFDRARSPCPGVEAGHFAWEAEGGDLISRLSMHFPAEALGETGPGYRITVPIAGELLPLIRTEYRADFAAGE